MADDYENLPDIDGLSDDELRALIEEQLEEYPDLDADLIELQIENGRVTLTGRVGTEQELQEFEAVLTDVLGIREVENELVVDALVRADYSEDADIASAQLASDKGPTGGGADRTEDSAEHLMQDTAAEQFGTNDVREAIERGYAYDPPDRPIQEGTRSRENH